MSDSDAAHAGKAGLLQLLLVVGQALLVGVQLVVSRLFGQAAYGLYMTALGILEVLSRAGTAGADKAMLRYIAAHRVAGESELESQGLATGLRLGALAAGALGLCLLVASPAIGRAEHKPDLALLLPWLAPALVAVVLTRILIEAMLAARAVRMNLYVKGFGEPALLLAFILAAAALGGGITRLGAAYLACALATCALAIACAARVFGPRNLSGIFRSASHPSLVGFALPAGGAELLNALFQRADLLVLGLFRSPSDVALFAAAEFLCSTIAATRFALDSIACGMISEALRLGDRARLRHNLRMLTRFVLLIAGFVFVTVASLRRELLSLYGPEFTAAAGVLLLLAIKHVINAGMGLTPWVLLMGGRSRLMLINNVGAAALAVALSFALIPRWGVLGAASAGLISEILLQLAYLAETVWLEKTHPFALPLLGVTLATAATAGVEWLLRGHVPLVVAGGLATYLVMLLVFGLGDEERRALRKLFA
jgi:O-antigen/teichoic acid export membrane protein